MAPTPAPIMKTSFASGKRPALYYWREHAGLEIDLLIEQADKLVALEAKSGQTITPNQLLGLKKLQQTMSDITVKPLLVYAGDEEKNLGNIQLVSWRNFVSELYVTPSQPYDE